MEDIKKILSVSWFILISGFIAGVLFNVSIINDVPTDEIGISTFILENICQVGDDLVNDNSYCWNMLLMFKIVVILVTIGIVIGTSMLIGHLGIGLGIYFTGALIGFIFML